MVCLTNAKKPINICTCVISQLRHRNEIQPRYAFYNLYILLQDLLISNKYLPRNQAFCMNII